MGVLIKGFKMPETCDYCPLSNYYPANERVWCNAESKILAENYDVFRDKKIEKPEWCPLEEVEDE